MILNDLKCFGLVPVLAGLAVSALSTGGVYAQVVPTAPTSVPNPLSLGQAISIALAHQPEQYIAGTQQTSASGTKTQAQSLYLPKVTPTYTYEMNSNTAVSPGVPILNSKTNGSTATIEGTQLLFDSGQREITNAQARRTVDIANDNATDIRETVIDAVTEDYYNLLLATDLVKVAQSQVASAQLELNLVQAQVNAGTVAAASVYQARANLANAQVTLEQDKGSVDTSSATLKNELGVDTTTVVHPVPLPPGNIQAAPSAITNTSSSSLSQSQLPTPPANPPPPSADTPSVPITPAVPNPTADVPANLNPGMPSVVDSELPGPPPPGPQKTLEEYLQIAYASRPDLREQKAMVEYDDLNVKQAEILAGLQVQGTYTYLYTPINDFGPTGSDSQLLATATFPLFDGGYSRAGVKIAAATRDAALDTFEQLRQSIHLMVEQALVSRTENLESANLALTALQAAEVNYDSEIAEQKAGLATVVDVTTAEVTLAQAQDQYVSAIYNFYVSDSALRRAIGQNDVTANGSTTP